MKKCLCALFIALAAGIFNTAQATQMIVGVAPGGNPIFAPPTFTINLGDTVLWTFAGGMSPNSYNITSTSIPMGATAFSAMISMAAPPLMYKPAVAGTYNYQAVGVAGMVGQFTVTSCAAPTATANGSTTVCQGKTDSLYVTATAAATYKWKLNNMAIAGATNSYYLATGGGTYTCVVKNSCLDSVTSNAIAVTVNTAATPTISFTNSGLACNFTGTASGATTWAWNFGDMGTSTQQNPQHTYAAAGTYTTTLIATNSAGCAATGTKSVQVSATGIGNTVLENDIVVSPNPASNIININSNNPKLTLSLYDVTGRMICAPKLLSKNANTMSFDVSSVPAGLYILRINGDVISTKLSVVR